jgi:hypothetical protein
MKSFFVLTLKIYIMKKRSIFLILILFSLFIYGCKYDFIIPVEVAPVNTGGNPISFSSQIAPIFSTGDKCIACHKTGGQTPDLTSANAFAQINPKYVNTASPADSKIYSYPSPTSSTHNWKKYTATEAALVLAWITEGAKNN